MQEGCSASSTAVRLSSFSLTDASLFLTFCAHLFGRNVGGSCAGDLSKVASLTVVGTGMPAWEGTYMIGKARIDGALAFQKDETHEVYRGGSGAWRLADYGGAVLYPD